MPVRRQMLGLDAGLVSGLDTRLRLMPGLGAGLSRRYRFSVAGRRPVGGVRSDIRVWG